jgi:predicted amidohydrolase
VHALEMLEQSASTRPDLVVLPEAVSMLCYPDGRPGFSYRDVMETVPGPTTDSAAAIARHFGVNVLIGLVSGQDDELNCQNVVVGIGRDGKMVGRYEKLHEPEISRRSQGARVGNSIPIITFDFGPVGVFVCWDLISPEIASIMALKGARLLCFPHLLALPCTRNFSVSLRARAVDNALPVVAAGMRDAHNHNGSQEGLFPTCIIDADGEVIAQSAVAGPDIINAQVLLAPVTADNLGIAEKGVDWTRHRPTELRPALYAREYAGLAQLETYYREDEI